MSETGRSKRVDITILLLAGVMFVGMVALGNWQLKRLAWKLDLIEAVETRAFGDPVPAPADAAPEYTRVFAAGTFAYDQSLRIKAVTELGPGFWIMTPLITADRPIWINRGFVPNDVDQDEWGAPPDATTVTGLVRPDQPGGTFLENNQPATGRWVSADLVEMTTAVGLEGAQTAYFIDAEQTDTGAHWPRGGLTRLSFRNTHLIYALTWYTMAAMFAAAMIYVIRDRLKAPD